MGCHDRWGLTTDSRRTHLLAPAGAHGKHLSDFVERNSTRHRLQSHRHVNKKSNASQVQCLSLNMNLKSLSAAASRQGPCGARVFTPKLNPRFLTDHLNPTLADGKRGVPPGSPGKPCQLRCQKTFFLCENSLGRAAEAGSFTSCRYSRTLGAPQLVVTRVGSITNQCLCSAAKTSNKPSNRCVTAENLGRTAGSTASEMARQQRHDR